ncbi:GNAT family N-acetyltransferase [Micromonospora sp. M12]
MPDDFLVAEDTATGRPVASLVGLRQNWSLAGVQLPVAQVELVGTAPEHRGNRLTEHLFAALHQRYALDGVPVQVIEGIPYFYRRLGYDYALANDGACSMPSSALPDAAQDRPDNPVGDMTVRRPPSPTRTPSPTSTDASPMATPLSARGTRRCGGTRSPGAVRPISPGASSPSWCTTPTYSDTWPTVPGSPLPAS